MRRRVTRHSCARRCCAKPGRRIFSDPRVLGIGQAIVRELSRSALALQPAERARRAAGRQRHAATRLSRAADADLSQSRSAVQQSLLRLRRGRRRIDRQRPDRRVDLGRPRQRRRKPGAHSAAGEIRNGEHASMASRAQYARPTTRICVREALGAHALDSDEAAFAAVVRALGAFEQDYDEFNPYTSKYDAYLTGRAKLERPKRAASSCSTIRPRATARSAISALRTADGGAPALSDYGLIAIGVPRNAAIARNRDAAFHDLGACGPDRKDKIGQAPFCGLFRTPTLRNVALRKTFFHNGKFHDLREVVEFYVTRDIAPERWYARNADGSVRVYDDLPAPYQANINRDAPFAGQRPGAKPQPRRARDRRCRRVHENTDRWLSRRQSVSRRAKRRGEPPLNLATQVRCRVVAGPLGARRACALPAQSCQSAGEDRIRSNGRHPYIALVQACSNAAPLRSSTERRTSDFALGFDVKNGEIVMQRSLSATAVVLGLVSTAFFAGCQRAEPEKAATAAPAPAPAVEVAKAPPPAPEYPTHVYFGDTHLHTALSLDAGVAGARLMPADAYRFAKGEEVTGASGQKAKLSRPLDFLVVTDHSDQMGLVTDLIAGKPEIIANPTAKKWYDMMQGGQGRRGCEGYRHDVRARQVPEGDHVQPGLARLSRHVGSHHQGRRRSQRARQVHGIHRATSGPRWSAATICTATLSFATTATRRARSSRSRTIRRAAPIRAICGNGWPRTKARPAARCWRSRTTATSATA